MLVISWCGDFVLNNPQFHEIGNTTSLYLIQYIYSLLTYKISAIWLVEKSTVLAIFYLQSKGMLLPLKSESLGWCNTNSQHVWKNYHLDQIVDRSNILWKFCFYFFLIMDIAFIVPSQCSFLKLQLHFIKKFKMIFAVPCFYFCQFKKCLTFLKFYNRLEILMFLSFVFVISVIHFQIRSSFSCEKKHLFWNLSHTFVEKLVKFNS